MHSAHWLRSFLVYAITTGVPVEPDDMWNSRRSRRSTQFIFSGYASRKSSFV